MRHHHCHYLLISLLLTTVFIRLAAPARAADDFRLREYLGHAWTHEAVTFPASSEQVRKMKAGQTLQGSDGKAISYQLVYGATPQDTRLVFQTDLAPYETRAFHFTDDRAPAATDLTVAETDDAITLANGQTGILIAKKLAEGRGPISALRLPSGAWVAGSRLASDQPLTRYEAKVIARGPVFIEVACRAAFGEGATWDVRFRLYAGEPVVLVDESAAIDGPAVTFTLDFQRNFNPDTLLYRSGMSGGGLSYGQNRTWKLAPGEVYLLEPWLRWQRGERRGNYFGLFREDGTDLLAVAAREAGAWVDPAVPAAKRDSPSHQVMQDAGGPHLDFPLKIGKRKWMLITLPKEPCLVETRDEKIACRSPLPYRYLIKYGHFPLDVVKDYVLEWDAGKETHPRLLITVRDLNRFLATARGNYYNLDGALAVTQSAVQVFLEQEFLPYGSAPHMWSRGVINAMLQSDIALREGEGTPEERTRLRAQLAFLGYTIARPEYWSPERGFSANPNMTTMVAGFRLAAGSLLSSHPCSAQWVADGLTELKHEMNTWSDDNGGWLEAPHYAMVSYDFILAGFLMAYNSTGDETVFSPRMRKIIEWYGKITTPPDSRTGGFRHLPPIGNTWLNEPSGEFGVLARLWKDRDPKFSAEMQWLWQQHRSLPDSGIGGSGHSTGGFRHMLVDPTLPAKAPSYGSELFPKTGVILRNVFPSDRETTLHMIAGPNHDHYDLDSGSITVWGKGRIVADDFGYNSQAPVYDHSMVESPVTGGIMQVQEFNPSPGLDYVRGTAGGWTRQIAFIKDADPLGPNYFVIADSLDKPVDATWRLWLTAQAVRLQPQQALAVGKEDVDTDIFFLQPQGVALHTEDKTCTTVGLDAEGVQKTLSVTQTGLIAQLPAGAGITMLLYPRLKNEPVPTWTVLAGGKGVKIQHGRGTDYVFLAATPFKFMEGDITFEGTAGVIRLAADALPTLSLGAPGRIAARGKEIKVDKKPE